eukprot:jgi/Ulvmu1/10076/UM006_0023.1
MLDELAPTPRASAHSNRHQVQSVPLKRLRIEASRPGRARKAQRQTTGAETAALPQPINPGKPPTPHRPSGTTSDQPPILPNRLSAPARLATGRRFAARPTDPTARPARRHAQLSTIIGNASTGTPAPPETHYPHHHPYIKKWSDINLLTDFPGCFHRRASNRLRTLRAAACFTDNAATSQMEAWYEPLRLSDESPEASAGQRTASPPRGVRRASTGVRLTRQRQEEASLRERAAPLLCAVTQKMHLVPLEARASAGTSSAHTSDAAAGLAMLAGDDEEHASPPDVPASALAGPAPAEAVRSRERAGSTAAPAPSRAHARRSPREHASSCALPSPHARATPRTPATTNEQLHQEGALDIQPSGTARAASPVPAALLRATEAGASQAQPEPAQRTAPAGTSRSAAQRTAPAGTSSRSAAQREPDAEAAGAPVEQQREPAGAAAPNVLLRKVLLAATAAAREHVSAAGTPAASPGLEDEPGMREASGGEASEGGAEETRATTEMASDPQQSTGDGSADGVTGTTAGDGPATDLYSTASEEEATSSGSSMHPTPTRRGQRRATALRAPWEALDTAVAGPVCTACGQGIAALAGSRVDPASVTAAVKQFTREMTSRAQLADSALHAAHADHGAVMSAVQAALLQLRSLGDPVGGPVRGCSAERTPAGATASGGAPPEPSAAGGATGVGAAGSPVHAAADPPRGADCTAASLDDVGAAVVAHPACGALATAGEDSFNQVDGGSLMCAVERLCQMLTAKAEGAERALRAAQHEHAEVAALTQRVAQTVHLKALCRRSRGPVKH